MIYNIYLVSSCWVYQHGAVAQPTLFRTKKFWQHQIFQALIIFVEKHVSKIYIFMRYLICLGKIS